MYVLTAIDPTTYAALGNNTMPINATLNGSVPEFSSAWVWIQGFLG